MAVRHAPAAHIGAVVAVVVALLLAAGPASAIIIQSDASELCTTNLAACQQQCMSAGQFAFQCDSGGTFGRPSSTCKCVKAPAGVQDSMAILKLIEFSNAPACGSQSWLYDCAQTATAQVIGGDFKIISGDAAASSAAAAATASPATSLGPPGTSASAIDASVGMPTAAATTPAAAATRQQAPVAANTGGLRMGVTGAPVPVPAASAAGAGMGVVGSGVRPTPGAVSASAVLAMNGAGGAAAAGGPMGGFGTDESFGRRLQQYLVGAAPAAITAPAFGAAAGPAFGAGMGMGAAPAATAGAAGIPSSDPFQALSTSAAADYGFPAAAAAAAPPNPNSPKCKQPVQGVVTSAVGGGLLVPGFKQVVTAVAQGNDTLIIQLPEQGCTATFQVVTGNLLSLSAAPSANATAANAKGTKSSAAAAAPGALFAAAAASLVALLVL